MFVEPQKVAKTQFVEEKSEVLPASATMASKESSNEALVDKTLTEESSKLAKGSEMTQVSLRSSPTLIFFESMGLTVQSFPPYLQANVKKQVSTLVHDIEYHLNAPNHEHEKEIDVLTF